MDGATGRYRADELVIFATALLERAGLVRDRARTVADVLVEADLLGHDTHGLDQLAGYLQQIEDGLLATSGYPEVISDFGAALTWDGHRLPGQWLVKQAIAEARNRILSHPIVTIAIGRGQHMGCLQAYYTQFTRLDINPTYERLFESFEIAPGVRLLPGEYRFTRHRSVVTTAAKRRLTGSVNLAWGNYWSGQAEQVTASVGYKLPPRFTITLSTNQTFARLSEGHFITRIATSNINYAVSPTLSFTNLIQYDNRSHNLGWQ